MKFCFLYKVIFVVLFALVINIFTYFAFGNVFSAVMFNENAFFEQYFSGVYRYRIFSSFFLYKLYIFLENQPYSIRINGAYLIDKNANSNMYLAYFIYNTFFVIIGHIILLLITETKYFIATKAEKILIIAISVFSVALSQFVMVPYDCSSYFFLFLFAYLLLKYLENKKLILLVLLSLIMIFSTLNRESSALSISIAAIILYNYLGFKKEFFWIIGVFIIVFLLSYFGIRIYFSSFDINNETIFWSNITTTRNLFGVLFWAVFFIFSLIIACNKKAIQNIFVFHLLALPYIMMCFYTGVLYEVRLYIPIFLSSIILARLSFTKRNISEVK